MDFAPALPLAFWSPPAFLIVIILIVIGILVLRFLIGTAVTLVKIAILVAIGVLIYFGLQWLFDNVV